MPFKHVTVQTVEISRRVHVAGWVEAANVSLSSATVPVWPAGSCSLLFSQHLFLNICCLLLPEIWSLAACKANYAHL